MGEGGGIVEKALSSLGRGFDLTSDFRLNYCKGRRRLVLLNEQHTRELHVPGFGAFKDVSADIKCDKGDRTRYQSDIHNFNQVSFFFFFCRYYCCCCARIYDSRRNIGWSDVGVFQPKVVCAGENPVGVFQFGVWFSERFVGDRCGRH